MQLFWKTKSPLIQKWEVVVVGFFFFFFVFFFFF